jgi:ribosomal protein S18 acetylase RimI-like enzyme
MIMLAPMGEADFAAFQALTVGAYAEDNVESARWKMEHALERSRAEFDRLLPQGIRTPNHHFLDIRRTAPADDASGPGEVVGQLWYAIDEGPFERAAYVYYIRVAPRFRGRGHAHAALELLEQRVRAQGLDSIALHVFSFNTTAQALYRSLGYWITGLNMRKFLRPLVP